MIRSFRGQEPDLHPAARVAENATVVGRVALGEGASVWYGAVLRGDCATIQVDAGANIQDNCILHSDEGYPLHVGEDVTVGHGAILHGCTVGERTLIGMGAVLLNGCQIGPDCLVAAGALVTQGMEVPAGSLVMGSPAKVKRPLRPEEYEELRSAAAEYRELSKELLPPVGKA